jgi:hypothetical protein
MPGALEPAARRRQSRVQNGVNLVPMQQVIVAAAKPMHAEQLATGRE